jgi:hypothetical protein
MNTIIEEIDGYITIEYDKCNVYIIENILESEFCKKMIKLIETLPLVKEVHGESNNVECFTVFPRKLLKKKNDFDYNFSTNIHEEFISLLNDNNFITNNSILNDFNAEELQNSLDSLNDKMKIISNIMIQINPNICFEYICDYDFRKIYGKTLMHMDSVASKIITDVNFISKSQEIEDYEMIRNTSLIFTLNDDYEGGIFEFPYYNIKLKLKKGSVIIFPPYWTHLHAVSTVENNTYRYTINTWSLEKLQYC